ncbi:DUF4255 domain-containing protein [Roseomonas marmotae]|uniref:DUF4255 domain-containing protein n=1 Tax=Roseomonas marmotae TaxID=2768161 RepID=A0ABS3KGT0_9PROT|nr:DUF4255 domain-containing protein [Roseomonas marmotae]MBO1076187.1 DUF4255 domain-containing protein [Roseomonas marmotae]QTI81777.1 DUF4255 domain-containing protein [Roseomonas marmotae]
MDGSILGDASLSLQRMLEDEIRISFPDTSVSLESPKLARPNAPGEMVVSLWLHRVSRQADMLNHPPRRIGPDRVEAPRLPIDLHFLATPLGGDAVTRQRLLGVTLQALQANAVLAADRLAAPLVAAGIDALRLHLEPYDTEDLARLWHALSEPFELCAAYVVDFVLLPAGSQPRPAARVVDRRLRFGAAPAVAG